MTWFKNNGIKANADKYHLLVNSNEKVCAKTGPCYIQSCEKQKLLKILIDNKLTFDEHVNNLCAKARPKLNALC